MTDLVPMFFPPSLNAAFWTFITITFGFVARTLINMARSDDQLQVRRRGESDVVKGERCKT